MNTLLTITTITSLLIVIILIISTIYETNKTKKKFKKDVDELKIGNRYLMKESFSNSNNPFEVETIIVEITDIKFNDKDELYVQYKYIEDGKPYGQHFSNKFNSFINIYDLIK